MKRYLLPHIAEFMDKKIILLTGPRQVGKTTLAKALVPDFAYHNYDIKKDVRVFLKQEWDRSKELVIFDELHKMKKWKLWLKGLYDEGLLKTQKVLVTGSARLDVAKKVGDSLAGRFLSYRLNPLDLKELKGTDQTKKIYDTLIRVGGFPEPYLHGTERYYNLWRRSHSDLILRQDLLSLEAIRDLDGLELLLELLSTRVGSTISYRSLAEDLDRDDKTIKKWLSVLENLYLVFRVSPYSKNLPRSLKKAGKYYFYDIGRIQGDESQRLENLVALSLKKEIEFQEDVNGVPGELYFIQTVDKKEIDFFVLQKNRRQLLVEVKLSDGQVSPNFELVKSALANAQAVQLVKNLDRPYVSRSGVQVVEALSYLENLDLSIANI